MAHTFARFEQLKRQFEEDWILLKDPYDYLWIYADDAEELADELDMKVQYNRKGRAFLKIKEDMLDKNRYALIGINDRDDAFFLRFVVYEGAEEELEEEPEEEPELFPATTWYVAEIESLDEIRRIIVVDDPDKTDEAEGTYNRKHPLAEAIMAADMIGEDHFLYRQADYHVEFLHREES